MTWQYANAVDRILDRLEGGGKRSGNGWMAKCPAHDDRKASLKIDQGDDRALLHCHAGCSNESIVAALGLTLADLFDEPRKDTGRGPEAVYDYVDEAGTLLFQVCRFPGKRFVQRRPDGKGGHVWKLGDTRRVLYRLPLVVSAIRAGYPVYVVEGEKDVHALEAAGVVATCNSGGAGKWRPEHTEALAGAKEVVIVSDKDEAGRKHVEDVAAKLKFTVETVRIVEPKEGKDAADHLEAGHGPDDFLAVAIEDAVWSEAAVSASSPDKPDNRTNERKPASLSEKLVGKGEVDTSGQTPALALESDILGRFRTDLRRAGVAGEERLTSILYLALTSRVLPWGKSTERPISVMAKGTSSTGKSHATRATLRFFPESAYLDLGSMSKRYLFYTEEDFAHRFIIVPEWASIADDEEIVALLRILLSEGRVIHGTVDKERTAQRIEKEGPTGLIVTTTATAVDPEMETRCLSILTDDTPEQTRRVYGVYADLEEEIERPVDFDAWHELQTWIGAHGETRVFVPFTRALAELMPAGATRLRRDFVSLLCLVRAHAILYQAQRERDPSGRIMATIEGDYAPIRSMVAELIAEGAEAGASPAIHETVATVRALLDEGAAYVKPKALIDRLGIGRSASYDRIHRALLSGYLANEAAKDERGMKLVVGALLPGEEDFLPLPGALSGSSPVGQIRQNFGSTMRPEEVMSGSPACPVTPRSERDFRERLRVALPNREVRRLLEAHRPELIGRNDITTPDERRELAALELQLERMAAADEEAA